jgi:hypothetical protein
VEVLGVPLVPDPRLPEDVTWKIQDLWMGVVERNRVIVNLRCLSLEVSQGHLSAIGIVMVPLVAVAQAVWSLLSIMNPDLNGVPVILPMGRVQARLVAMAARVQTVVEMEMGMVSRLYRQNAVHPVWQCPEETAQHVVVR